MTPAVARWRSLVTALLGEHWPSLPEGPRWLLAQVETESGGDPRAESPAGARGLLQLMPGTATEVGVLDPFDPAQNLRGGITYLRDQYDHLPEIPSHDERLLWAFASYVAGRGYVNRALALARVEGQACWWKWEVPGRFYLFHRACRLGEGKYADHVAVWSYVAKIQERAR